MPTKAVTAEELATASLPVVLHQEDMRLPVTAAAAGKVTAAVLPIRPQRHKEVLMALNMDPTVELQMLIR
jgi:hypothetical protein